MESLAKLPKDEQLAFMLEQGKSAGLVPEELDVSQAHRFIKLLRNDLRATQNYGLRLYPGRITFFKANETPAGTSPALDPTMGWSEWASSGVEVHVVPGNHANLMYKPHVKVLAEKLTACLNQAQSAEVLRGFPCSMRESTAPCDLPSSLCPPRLRSTSFAALWRSCRQHVLAGPVHWLKSVVQRVRIWKISTQKASDVAQSTTEIPKKPSAKEEENGAAGKIDP
jgi:hypothetical protein